MLETISVSHYVEKVRWVLDYLAVPYTEEVGVCLPSTVYCVDQENVGILGLVLTGRTVPRLRDSARAVTIGNSADILRYLQVMLATLHSVHRVVQGKLSTDPAAAAFLQPSQETLQLETELDLLGDHLRRWTVYRSMTR